MRCTCCNKILTPRESVRKFKLSGDYADICDGCLETIDVDVIEGLDGDYEDIYVDDE